jgi:AcrR family transcriptional regulator/GNAT superfamily N-acetyltransferase
MVLSAMQLFRRHGYSGTGFREVVNHSSSPRGSIYHHFPGGKAQLGVEAVTLARDFVGLALEEALRGRGPVEGFAAFLAWWIEFLEADDFEAGCPVLAVAVESQLKAPQLLAAAASAFEGWEATLARALREAGVDPRPAGELATLCVAAVEGAMVMCRATHDRQPLVRVGAQLMAALEAAVVAADVAAVAAAVAAADASAGGDGPGAGGTASDLSVLTIRAATADDAGFLAGMVAVAVDWRPGSSPRPVASVADEPALAHYVSDWPRHGEAGFVGITEDRRPLGAAWWRFFTPLDPGYGFVDPAIPEVSIGVVSEARGHGVGTRLLQALIDEGRRRALPGLSLSVECDNPARALYERLGFTVVGLDGAGSVTMVLNLHP